MDYSRRLYVQGKSYSKQMGFQIARPETNVKLITTKRSQVNFHRTPSTLLNKPYQHDTYNEMPYLFSGYPAVRRNWFDSLKGGQESEIKEYATKPVMPFAHMIQRIDGTWDAARNTASGENIYYETNEQINCTSKADGPDFGCQRIFIGFNLRNVDFYEIDSCYFGCYASYPSAYNYTTISIQESYHNPFIFPASLSTFSKFKGAPFAIRRFASGWNLLKLNRSGVKYIKNRMGRHASFCIREYDHDFKDVDPVAPSTYTNAMFVSTVRLFINHKGRIVIIDQTTGTSGDNDGQKLVPA